MSNPTTPTAVEASAFRKKPVTIHAVQWDGTYSHAKQLELQLGLDTLGMTSHPPSNTVSWWKIATLEDGHVVSPLDWIITGVKGEHYPCKPDIFELTYERAELASQQEVAQGFDAWQNNPYTKVLQESIARDYVPRSDRPQEVAAPVEISRSEWIAQAKAFYVESGDDDATARECARYICNQQDWAGGEIGDPREEAQEDIHGRGRTGLAALAASRVPVASVAEPEHWDKLRKLGWRQHDCKVCGESWGAMSEPETPPMAVGAGGAGVMDARPDSFHSDSGECGRVQGPGPTDADLLKMWKSCKAIDNREFCIEFGRAVLASTETTGGRVQKDLADMHHDLLVVMQAAWIEWQRGAGANSAMQWIHNTLMGPGLIPDDDEPYASEPQAYFDKNKAEPFPECFCGRPSNQLWMGKGFCGKAHYNEHRAAILAKGGDQGEGK